MANVKHQNKVYTKNLNINTRWDMTYLKNTHTHKHTHHVDMDNMNNHHKEAMTNNKKNMVTRLPGEIKKINTR